MQYRIDLYCNYLIELFIGQLLRKFILNKTCAAWDEGEIIILYVLL